MKAYMRSRGIAPLVLNFGTRWGEELTTEKNPGIRGIGGWMRPVSIWTFRRRELYLTPTSIRTPDCPDRSKVAVPNTLLRLL